MDFITAVLVLSICAVEPPVNAAASVQIAPATTPAQAVEAAAVDLASIPKEIQPLTRYLWAGNIPEKERAETWKTLSFHCNSLSTQPEIVVPRVLPGGTVAALNLADYGWEKKTWEKLIDHEVYFHMRVVSKPKDGKEKAETIFAPWAAENPAALKALVAGTQSQVPIYRADSFLWQSAQEADRGESGYYSFIGGVGGIKNEADFEEIIGFDAKVLRRFPKVTREAVANSSVTLQPRRIERFATVGGAYWRTSDVRQAQGNKNPLQILNGGFTADAHEDIANAPNGLHLYFLGNAKNEAQASAPDFIASDSTSSSNDRRVHVGISCVRCHSGSAGINSIDGWVRNLANKPLSLQSPDYQLSKKFQRLYFSQLDQIIDDDRRIYARAVATTNGREPKANGEAYGRMYADYDSPVSLEKASRELGVTPEKFVEILKNHASKTPEMDLVIGSFMSEKPKAIPRVVWRDNFSNAMILVGSK